MPYVGIALAAIGVAFFGWWLARRGAANGSSVAFASEREETLAKRVASTVRCALPDALAAVRKELQFAPNQSDDVIAKRAAYHYDREHPAEHRVTYCDRVRG